MLADLLRRHHRRVEDVHPAVGRVGQPELLVVGRQADPMAGAAVPLGRPLLKPRHLDAIQLLARLQVAHLEAEQLVDVHEAERLGAVDRERPDARGERADRADDLVRLRIGDRQGRRIQPGEIGFLAVRADDRVVRARPGA